MKTTAMLIEGIRSVHMTSEGGSYATFCGLDGEESGQLEVPTEPGDRINCPRCVLMWKHAKRYGFIDFAPEEKR